jgi:pSer/pThr/pTyr-binding forkhead associated (FHA) protein
LIETLKESIHAAGRDAGLDFASPPTLSLATDSSVPAGEARVIASHKVETLGATSNVVREEAKEPEETNIPSNAFLIIDGRKVFPLKMPVINIGRRLENHLVIDDPRISRTHTQLRAIKGRYVIFDLNSTGGTFVNGQRTSQTVLYPGDVISLAGVTLVFGQDNPPPRPDLKETGPFNAQTADRPTAILKDRTDIRKKKK